MNRALQRRGVKRYSARKHGGGYGMGAPLVAQPTGPGSDWSFAVKQPINAAYSDCDIPARPGQIFNTPQPALAQVAMVGGGDSNLESHAYIAKEWTQSAHGSGATAWGNPEQAQVAMAGGKRRRRRSMRGGRRGCGCSGSKLFGGSRRRRATRRHRGGSNGYSINPGMSVGGTGPNVGAVVAGVPCDSRAGVPVGAAVGNPDPRAPADLYSLSSSQAGGAYSSGNAYGGECYKAPGSALPVYEAQTAGFEFRPSTAAGATLPDGVTAYNEVVPVAARMGGGRRRSRRNHRRSAKKSRKHRRSHH